MDSSAHNSASFENDADPETSSHTFVLKVWVEEYSNESRYARWRGRITHVLNGSYIYFEDLGTLHNFIVSYLETLNVDSASLK